ncbi:MAG: FKBP-type peptidyl-prolyl cis-trans isomerase [Lachnospiraceae bacterium]|nr:FKBP-type peptidyl-prolyl cis-trans isomerase [Lachnospiraceae bacterium]
MKIAVTYENGEVFQHFGHSEQFKVYEIENGQVISSEIVSAEGSGHSALASLLAGRQIGVLICGGIGGGAQAALEQEGIELCAGAAGNADEAVAAYLRGELENTGANCDHHGEEHDCGEHGCGGQDAGSQGESDGCGCGNDCSGDCGDCGSGCGGCAGCRPALTGKNVGRKCTVHYRGTFNDGTQFDASYDRGEPLEFICGAGMMIPGFDAAVADMEIGETVQVHLMPSEAYGEADPDAIFSVETARLAGSAGLAVGDQVYLQNVYGQHIPVRVVAKDETTVTFDANHEMAGKELNFTIELVDVSDPD